MIFYIKIGKNFRRKDSLVAGGHKKKSLSSITYSSVVLQDSGCICLMILALKNLDIQSVNIENAYLTDPWQEKIWTRAGPEFGKDEGKLFIILWYCMV